MPVLTSNVPEQQWPRQAPVSQTGVCYVCTTSVHFHRLGKHLQHAATTISPQPPSLQQGVRPKAPYVPPLQEKPATVAVRRHLSARQQYRCFRSMGGGGGALHGVNTAHAAPQRSCREHRSGCIRLPFQTSVVTLISPGRATAAILEIS